MRHFTRWVGVFLMGLPAAGVAAPIVGQLTTSIDGQIAATSRWNGDGDAGFTIAWNIERVTGVDDAFYRYQYTFSNATGGPLPSPAVSHFILGVSENFVESDFLSGSWNTGGADRPIRFSLCDDSVEVGWFGPAKSNPAFPADAVLHGAKFDFGSSDFTLTFDTRRVPVPGSFYAKAGRDTAAYNTGLADPEGAFIVVPDTAATPPVTPQEVGVVPLPATAWAGAIGLSLVILRRRLRHRSA